MIDMRTHICDTRKSHQHRGLISFLLSSTADIPWGINLMEVLEIVTNGHLRDIREMSNSVRNWDGLLTQDPGYYRTINPYSIGKIKMLDSPWIIMHPGKASKILVYLTFLTQKRWWSPDVRLEIPASDRSQSGSLMSRSLSNYLIPLLTLHLS